MNRERCFDVAVIGAGMMGSAAARHLAEAGLKVVLIGPAEPADKTSHDGVFASHYDAARITRKLDQNHDWSKLSMRSIDRYRQIEARGKQTFFHETGAMMAGPEFGDGAFFIRSLRKVAKDHGIDHEELNNARLAERFPFFRFPDGILALYEPGQAGWINPRDHIQAQINAGVAAGLIVHRAEAVGVVEGQNEAIVTCRDDVPFHAAKVVVACGAFSSSQALLADPPTLKVYARTVTFFRIDEMEAERLATMPSLILRHPDFPSAPYVLPPVRYPDGKTYVKIGGDPHDIELSSDAQIKDWFKGNGEERAGQFIAEQLIKLMPDLRYETISRGSCVTSFTRSAMPVIQHLSQHRYVLTGGNGAGAKCADELGRLCARMLLHGDLSDEGYETDFGLD